MGKRKYSKMLFRTYGYPIISVILLALFLFIDLGYWIFTFLVWHIAVTVWHIFKSYIRENDNGVKLIKWIINIFIMFKESVPNLLPKNGDKFLEKINEINLLDKVYVLGIFIKYNLFGILSLIAFSITYCYLEKFGYCIFSKPGNMGLSFWDFLIYTSHHYILSSPENISSSDLLVNIGNFILSIFFIFITVVIITHVMSLSGKELKIPDESA